MVPELEGAEESAVGKGDVAPGAFAEGEDEAVNCAHEGDADGGDEVEPVDRVAGEGVAVGKAVVYEGEEPYEDVGEGVDEHEAELAVDAEVLLGEVLLHV